MRVFLPVFLALCLLFSSTAEARYRYSGPGCNFRITFPEAPVVETIWPDDPLPFWDVARGFGEVGEKAFYARAYPGEGRMSFEATCVKADQELINSFDQGSMFITLKETYAGYMIQSEDLKYSDDPVRGVKWASISGFHVNDMDETETISAHFVIGKSSIMILKSTLIGDSDFLKEEHSDVLYSIISE